MDKTVQYIKCPRCELNYIQKKDKYCDVCKLEMKAGSIDELDDEILEGEELELCPICKTNYISDGEPMCSSCLEERSDAEKEEEVDWRSFVNKEDESEELDLLPVENDEIDEELGNAFAKDLEEMEEETEEDEEFSEAVDDIEEDFEESLDDDDIDEDDEDDEDFKKFDDEDDDF